MNRYRMVLLGIVLIMAAALAAWGCAQRSSSGSKTVKLAVTDRGFEPREIHARSGEPLTLLVTRKTDATCAKEILITEAGIQRELPLGEEVAITFTPAKNGEVRYACPMDMIAGRLIVQ